MYIRRITCLEVSSLSVRTSTDDAFVLHCLRARTVDRGMHTHTARTHTFKHTIRTQGRHGLHIHVYGDFSEGLTGAGAWVDWIDCVCGCGWVWVGGCDCVGGWVGGFPLSSLTGFLRICLPASSSFYPAPGAIFNPFGKAHGAPDDDERMAGDLGESLF